MRMACEIITLRCTGVLHVLREGITTHETLNCCIWIYMYIIQACPCVHNQPFKLTLHRAMIYILKSHSIRVILLSMKHTAL